MTDAKPTPPSREIADHIDDLIHPEDYAADPEGRKIRIEIRFTDDGVRVVGDSQRARELEEFLSKLEPAAIRQMLCG